MEKVQWNSVDKKQNGLKYLKNDKSSTLPTTVIIYSWKCRVMTSCASHMISHSMYWWLYSEQRVENVLLHIMVTNISKLYLMPNISMIEKVIQQVCAIDYFVSMYTFLLINQFIQRQNFLIDEVIFWMGLLSSSIECLQWNLFCCKYGF